MMMATKIIMHTQIKTVVDSLQYLPLDWRVVPTFGKKPIEINWQEKFNYSPAELQEKLVTNQMKIYLERSNRSVTPTGVAVVCGHHPQGNLIAVDCDGEASWSNILELCEASIPEKIEEIRSKALQFLPPTVAFTSGSSYRAQYLYLVPPEIPIKSIKLEKLELRGNHLASVLPPSFHPKGRKYR